MNTTDIRTAKCPVECYDARVALIVDQLHELLNTAMKLDRREHPNWTNAGELARITQPLTEVTEVLNMMTRDL